MAPRRNQKQEALSNDQEKDVKDVDEVERRTRRNATIFDAVAGRVYTNGFINNATHNRKEAILAPEEVLFKSRTAPERSQEDDYYWADRNLDLDTLPDSDLLKVIHSFASDYYHGTTIDQGQSDVKSLDDSALLAFGILLEESAKGILGSTGDMSFVEGQAFEDPATAKVRLDSGNQRTRVASVGSSKSRRSSKRQRR